MKPTILENILEKKEKRVEIARQLTNFPELINHAYAARKNRKSHALRTALEKEQSINIIAEIKRASPSRGVINEGVDVSEAAKSYANGGACAISVLTEEDFFKGSLDDLKLVRKSVDLPILRKDFIFDEFQIYEAAAAGADAILLIVASLENKALEKLYYLAENELGLDALVEVHTMRELEIAAKLGPRIIGVNNRNLNTFEVSLDVSRELIRYKPEDVLMVTESGLQSRDDIIELKNIGFSGFLIGETLMRSGDTVADLRNFTAFKTGDTEKCF